MTAGAHTPEAHVAARLDTLAPEGGGPLCLGLSGGGDSRALLAMAGDWARARGRILIPLIVDHGLQAASSATAEAAAAAARALGLAPRILRWDGAKPKTGVQEAARDARQALLAQACREAGAAHLLLAHTEDDQAETVWLRAAAGSTWRGLAAMRARAPSPVWPEGRGVQVLRPLLDVPRAALRAALRERGANWIEDPANDDRRFARVRARQALAALGQGPRARLLAVAGHARALADAEDTAARALWAEAGAATPEGALTLSAGALRAPGAARLLQLALAAVSGQAREPARDQTLRALAQLRAGAAAALGGAVATARRGAVLIHRDPGALLGRAGVSPVPSLNLTPGEEAVWDGRFAVTAHAPGLKAGALGRDLSFVAACARERLAAVPPPLRPVLPVLRDGPAVVAAPALGLGGDLADLRPLAEERLRHLLIAAPACFDALTTPECAES